VPNIAPDDNNLTAALKWAEAGWYVLPVRRGTKNPGSIVGEHWHHQSSRDQKQIAAWFAGTDHDIAVHCGRSGAVVLDVDKPELVPEHWRTHLDTAPYQSTRPDTPRRGHYIYAMPPDRSIGNPTFPGGEIRGLNGVIVVANSFHKDGGEYRVRRTGPLPVLPDEIADQLHDSSPGEDAATDQQVAAFLVNHQRASHPDLLLGPVRQLEARIAEGESRHDTTVSALVWAMDEAAAGCYRADDAAAAIKDVFLTAIATQRKPDDRVLTGARAVSEYSGMVAWAVGQARAKTAEELTDRRARAERNGNRDNAIDLTAADEETFWTSCGELTACRAYARAVRVGPWAMLGAALAFTSATIPPHVVLPGLVGDYASVNLYVLLPGESGRIKSAAISAAKAWLRAIPAPENIKPGSGQGIAKCFAYIKRDHANKPKQVGKRWTAVAVIPEIDTLTAAGAMTGSSLWAEFRSAWSDERVGHDYTDAEKTIILQPRRYRLCMIVGAQPLRTRPLLDDIDAGTPQRFVWIPLDDPGAPEQRPNPPAPLRLPRWPEDRDLRSIVATDEDRAQLLHEPVDRDALHVLDVPPEAAEAIDTVAREKLRGNPDIDPLDGHRLLCQLKVAAALMRLRQHTEISSQDWELAGTVMAVSDATREQVRAKLAADTTRRNRANAELSGTRKIVETRMAATAEAEDIARVAEVVVTALAKADGQTLPGHKVNKAAMGRDRHLVPKALEYLQVDGRIQVEDIEYRGRAGTRITLLDDEEQTQ
jgi:Bifunctional DNA primase/polymerase, N-terminal